jgi:hypothetical protein
MVPEFESSPDRCPALMKDRARKSKLSTFDVVDNGAAFLGSKDFPKDLRASCLRHDPKALLFGTDAVEKSPSAERITVFKRILDGRVKGKRFMVCSGGDDKLVPYVHSKPFLDFLEEANKTWYQEGHVYLENKLYGGVGHTFSVGMVKDALRFLIEALATHTDGGSDENRPRI